MDLSYEARWLNLRRELEEAAATLETLTHPPSEAVEHGRVQVGRDPCRTHLHGRNRTRNRAPRMTEPCPQCPFKGCPQCQHKGGE